MTVENFLNKNLSFNALYVYLWQITERSIVLTVKAIFRMLLMDCKNQEIRIGNQEGGKSGQKKNLSPSGTGRGDRSVLFSDC